MTTLFGNTAAIPIAAPKKKRSLLPLLTVVFMGSYGLMTMLIVEQGATIQAQRSLIQALLSDSKELWAMKGKAISDKAAQAQAQSRVQAPSTQIPLTQAPLTQGQSPSVQTPSTQIPSIQTPSTQAVPQQHSRSRAGKTAKPRTQVPQTQVPPVPASDLADHRRALITL